MKKTGKLEKELTEEEEEEEEVICLLNCNKICNFAMLSSLMLVRRKLF